MGHKAHTCRTPGAPKLQATGGANASRRTAIFTAKNAEIKIAELHDDITPDNHFSTSTVETPSPLAAQACQPDAREAAQIMRSPNSGGMICFAHQ
jgi:hypothetical protein